MLFSLKETKHFPYHDNEEGSSEGLISITQGISSINTFLFIYLWFKYNVGSSDHRVSEGGMISQ
jgi:hypothetical protein